MSTIKVDSIATRTGSGNITVSNNIAGAGTISGTNITASGTFSGNVATNSITTASGSTITIPSGKTLKSTDTPFIGSGNVIQMKSTYSTGGALTTTSTSYVGSGITLAITPKSATSVIMIEFCCGLDGAIGGSDAGGSVHTIYFSESGGSYARIPNQQNNGYLMFDAGSGATGNSTHVPTTLRYLHDHNTTNALVYQPYIYKMTSGSGARGLRRDWGGALLTATEIET